MATNNCQVLRGSDGKIVQVQAPNGNDSKLHRDLTDLMEGDKEKALDLWAQVYTPSFANWFGDWQNDPASASKVVDENGEPLMVYHGSIDDRWLVYDDDAGEYILKADTFKPNTHFGTLRAAEDRIRYIKLHADSVRVEQASDMKMPVFLSMKNPMLAEDMEGKKSWLADVERAKDEMYDGIRYINLGEDAGSTSYVAFDSTQVKSVYNNGKFSDRDPNIYFNRDRVKAQMGPEVYKHFDRIMKSGLFEEKNGQYYMKPAEYSKATSGTYAKYTPVYEQRNNVGISKFYDYLGKHAIDFFDLQETKDGTRLMYNPTRALEYAKQQRDLGDNNSIIGLARDNTPLNRMLAGLQERLGVPYKFFTPEEAPTLTDGHWNGENAFYYKGAVHLLDGGVTPETALHEFAHPFIMAVRQENEPLYNKLVADAMSSSAPGVRDVVDKVAELYPEHTPDTHMFKDEVMARLLAGVGSKNIDPKTGDILRDALHRFMYFLKQVFRRAFGDKLDLGKLGLNTTMSELADMLTMGKFDLKPQQGEVYPVYNRELAEDLQKMVDEDQQKMHKLIDTHFRVLQDHVQKLSRSNYSKLNDLLKNDRGTNLLRDAKANAKSAIENMENDRLAMRAFSEEIVSVNAFSRKMAEHIKQLSRDNTLNSDEKLVMVHNYARLVNDWSPILDEMRRGQDLPIIGSYVADTRDNFERFNDFVGDIYKEGVVQKIKPFLEPLSKRVKADLDPQIEELQKAYDGGQKNVGKRLAELKQLRSKVDLSDENIAKFLVGQMGDVNAYSSFLESYSSNPDPIVAGFDMYITSEMHKMTNRVQERDTQLRLKLDPLLKEVGYSRTKPQEMGKKLLFLDTVPSIKEDGTVEPFKVWTMLHEYGNGWRYDYKKHQVDIELAKRAGDFEKEKQLRAEFNQYKRAHFNQEYVDSFYDRYTYWDKDDVTREAYRRRKEITDELKVYNNSSQDLTTLDFDRKQELEKQLKFLATIKNSDGSPKEGMDLQVAEAIRSYNQQFGKYYHEVEIKGKLDRELAKYKEGLVDQGIQADTQEYQKQVNNWLKDNLRFRLTDQFYQRRQDIADQISQLTSKLPKDQAAQLNISKVWEDIQEQVKGYRDSDGQPIATDMEQSKLGEIRKLQNKLEDIKDNLRKLSGLTPEEEAELYNLLGQARSGQSLSQEDYSRIDELSDQSKMQGLDKADKAILFNLFDQLGDLQSSIPTEYYLQVFNERTMQLMDDEMTSSNARDILKPSVIDPMKQKDAEFAKWFDQNHMLKNRWNKDGNKMEEVYERLYPWSRIVPNNKEMLRMLDQNDYQGLMQMQNPLFKVIPESKYFFPAVKPEYKTKVVVGENMDNMGNWLPKPTSDKYKNEDYFKLKEAADPQSKALYSILEHYKTSLMKTQEGLGREHRVYYDLPRLRKHELENLSNIGEHVGNVVGNVLSKARAGFMKAGDDYEQGLTNYDRARILVMTDLFGNEINSIPMEHTTKLEHEHVSMDVDRAVARYMVAAEKNKVLNDINPFAQALHQTVSKNGITDTNKIAKRNILNVVGVKTGDNKRAWAINNLIERRLYGIDNKQEFGELGNKVLSHLMKFSAMSSLAINTAASVKNLWAGRLQNILESTTGQFYTMKELYAAEARFISRYMPKLSGDHYKYAGKSLETQMFQIFEPNQEHYIQHMGHEGVASVTNDLVEMKFLLGGQKMGEVYIQGTAMIASLMHQKVPMTDEQGNTKMIPYEQAWELRDGVIQLKKGVDPSWDKDGNNFSLFKQQMQKVTEFNQGAYAKGIQPELDRYMTGKMFLFMRKFFIPGLMNRFSTRRANFAEGTLKEGYYVTGLRLMQDTLRNGMKNWKYYTQVEKMNVLRTAREVATSVMFMGALMALGFNEDDKDKYKKLKDNSWAENQLIYDMLLTKSEAETFIPWFGMGSDELMRMKDTPSIAFTQMNRMIKMMDHFIQWTTGDNTAYYQKSQGIHKQGDVKFLADLFRSVGYTGVTSDPEVGIRQYEQLSRRYR